jgi:hypothetical protein
VGLLAAHALGHAGHGEGGAADLNGHRRQSLSDLNHGLGIAPVE